VRQRGEFFATLLSDANRGGWVFVRPRPSPDVSVRLIAEQEEEAAISGPSSGSTLASLAEMVSPEGRPLLEWILKSNVLSAREAERLAEATGPSGFEEDLLDVVYEALPASSRDTAKRLSCLRQPQPVNGSLGPFPLTENPTTPWLRARDVAKLRESGLLQMFSNSTLRMPRGVRGVLRARAEHALADEWRNLHRWLGHLGVSSLPNDIMETHYHAVQGGVVDDAITTARYYATDLRDLAYRLGHDEKRHAEAADVYRTIVNYDDEDAYAWEYLGFNLALRHGRHQPTQPQSREVLGAYERAFELEPTNPLYHGRLLGYRAFLGEDVEMAFHRGMTRYSRDYRNTDAVSFFAEPILRGMDTGRWGERRFKVVESWLAVLRLHERLRPLIAVNRG
jgi:hypothetical protein